MKAFRTIKSYNSCFGEYAYRATSNDSEVHIQEKSPRSKTWKIIRKMPEGEFYELAEELGIYDFDRDNPAKLLKIVKS